MQTALIILCWLDKAEEKSSRGKVYALRLAQPVALQINIRLSAGEKFIEPLKLFEGRIGSHQTAWDLKCLRGPFQVTGGRSAMTQSFDISNSLSSVAGMLRLGPSL